MQYYTVKCECLCVEAVGSKVSDHRIFGCPLDVRIVERVVPVIKFLHRSDCKF